MELLITAKYNDIENTKLFINNGLNPLQSLIRAAVMDDSETMKLLIDSGVSVKPNSGNEEVLVMAALNGHIDVVKVFIEAGADLHYKYKFNDTSDYTSLSIVLSNRHTKIVELLTEADS